MIKIRLVDAYSRPHYGSLYNWFLGRVQYYTVIYIFESVEPCPTEDLIATLDIGSETSFTDD